MIPPVGKSAGRVQAPDCTCHRPFSDEVDCAVSSTRLLAVSATPSIVVVPDSVWLVVATTIALVCTGILMLYRAVVLSARSDRLLAATRRALSAVFKSVCADSVPVMLPHVPPPPPPDGACHVAWVLSVAVRTYPVLGATEDDTLTTVVAELSASAFAAVPVVFWLNVGNVFVPEVKSLLVRV